MPCKQYYFVDAASMYNRAANCAPGMYLQTQHQQVACCALMKIFTSSLMYAMRCACMC